MEKPQEDRELTAMSQSLKALEGLESHVQERVIRWLCEKLKLKTGSIAPTPAPSEHTITSAHHNTPPAATNQPIYGALGTVKEFLTNKNPRKDIERIACLGYYHSRKTGNARFKTIDLSKLNAEAQYPKLSSASVAARNATNSGLLATTGGGFKCLTPAGEAYVEALPDMEAAKTAFNTKRVKRRHKSAQKAKRASPPSKR